MNIIWSNTSGIPRDESLLDYIVAGGEIASLWRVCTGRQVIDGAAKQPEPFPPLANVSPNLAWITAAEDAIVNARENGHPLRPHRSTFVPSSTRLHGPYAVETLAHGDAILLRITTTLRRRTPGEPDMFGEPETWQYMLAPAGITTAAWIEAQKRAINNTLADARATKIDSAAADMYGMRLPADWLSVKGRRFARALGMEIEGLR